MVVQLCEYNTKLWIVHLNGWIVWCVSCILVSCYWKCHNVVYSHWGKRIQRKYGVGSTMSEVSAKNHGCLRARGRLFGPKVSGKLINHLLTDWLIDWLMTSHTHSSQHHAASSLRSSWLSWSWILIHEIETWSQGWGACALAAWSSLKHLLYIQTETQKNRKSNSDIWACGPVARACFLSKINEAQRCQLSPFNSPP